MSQETPEVAPVEPVPESPWAGRPTAAARGALLVSLALVPVSVVIGVLVAGADGARGAALGALVPLLVLALTWLTVEIGRRRPPTTFAFLLVASYAVKLTVVAFLLRLLREVPDVDRVVLGLTAGAGLLLAVTVEAVVISRTRAPYVEP